MPLTLSSELAFGGNQTTVVAGVSIPNVQRSAITITVQVQISIRPVTSGLVELTSTVSISQWRRVARLARIAIPEDELAQFCAELNSILDFVRQLSEVDVTGVEPMTSVMPMQMKKRQDVVTAGDNAEAVLKNAPATQDSYFLVPKVIE